MFHVCLNTFIFGTMKYKIFANNMLRTFVRYSSTQNINNSNELSRTTLCSMKNNSLFVHDDLFQKNIVKLDKNTTTIKIGPFINDHCIDCNVLKSIFDKIF